MSEIERLMKDRQKLRDGLAELRKVRVRFDANLEHHRRLYSEVMHNVETFRKLQDEFRRLENSSRNQAEGESTSQQIHLLD